VSGIDLQVRAKKVGEATRVMARIEGVPPGAISLSKLAISENLEAFRRYFAPFVSFSINDDDFCGQIA
jgi:hypothetical protein